jgi:hypothetical protein
MQALQGHRVSRRAHGRWPVSCALPWDASISDRAFYLQHAQLARASRDRWMRVARETAARCVEAARAQSKHCLNCTWLAELELLP